MRRWSFLLLVVISLVAVTGCGRGGGGEAAKETDGAGTGTDEPDTTDATTEPLDQSAFCVAIRGLEALGTAPSAGDGTPTQVLEQNAQLAGLIDDAATNAPDDAPPDVAALFDDYRLISQAIVAAAGDRDAAMATLTTDAPELLARLGEPDAHRESFAFFAERCGTAAPS